MTTATISRPFSFAGAPLSAWAFGVRIWIAVVVALAAAFWLELDAPSTAAVTVAILAAPTRGPALDKALYRFIATFIGVAAAIAITGLFSQARDLLLVAIAAWVGLCVYTAGLLDGNRAYAAVLSGYTVALVAVEQIDAPQNVFDTGAQRGAAIVVGIAATALVNDLLATPGSSPRLTSQLTALHRRVSHYIRLCLDENTAVAATAAGLLRDIASLLPEMDGLAAEAAGGAARSTAARTAAVALVAQVHAARALNALPTDLREKALARLDQSGHPSSIEADADQSHPLSSPEAWASREFLRRDAEVRSALVALNASARPPHAWRTPLYRSQRLAVARGIRAAAWFALPSAFFVLAGWPTTDISLSLVAVLIGLGATTPDPKGFTVFTFIATPIIILLSGTLEFIILDGVNEFELLALALAPFMIGATVLLTKSSRLLSSLGRVNLILILDVVAPSNPPSYNPQSYLFISLFLLIATGLLLIAQILVPTESDERRRRWITTSARRDFDRLLFRRDRRFTPEEAMFRDATRIGLIPFGPSPADSAGLIEALSYFDRAAVTRLCHESLTQLAATSLSPLAAEADSALATQDAARLREVSLKFENAGYAEEPLVQELSGALALAAIVVDAAAPPDAVCMETPL
jgi:uncharacterized membrane protein YccC